MKVVERFLKFTGHNWNLYLKIETLVQCIRRICCWPGRWWGRYRCCRSGHCWDEWWQIWRAVCFNFCPAIGAIIGCIEWSVRAVCSLPYSDPVKLFWSNWYLSQRVPFKEQRLLSQCRVHGFNRIIPVPMCRQLHWRHRPDGSRWYVLRA